MNKIKVSFICHGNICRSPMAEFIFKKLVEESGLSSKFYIDSKAVSYEECGNPVYPPASAELKKHGISCEGKRAVTITRNDYDNYDYFVYMDDWNYRLLSRIFENKSEKIYKLLSFTGSNRDVSDPWYSGDFTTAYNDIYNGCKAFLLFLKDKYSF
jgi:protein-tyrosine phosphatase